MSSTLTLLFPWFLIMPIFFGSFDFISLFTPSTGIAEMIVRGSFVYLFLFVVLRILRRETGAIGIADLLVVVLVADAAQNAMAHDYESITEGFVLVATIVFWNFTLDWLSYRFPRFQRLVRPAPLVLVQDGVMNRKNMRREMITKEELLSQLREHGVEDISQVKRCYMEGDGHFSVIKKENSNGGGDDEGNEAGKSQAAAS